jgi:hypothetical protein
MMEHKVTATFKTVKLKTRDSSTSTEITDSGISIDIKTQQWMEVKNTDLLHKNKSK